MPLITQLYVRYLMLATGQARRNGSLLNRPLVASVILAARICRTW